MEYSNSWELTVLLFFLILKECTFRYCKIDISKYPQIYITFHSGYVLKRVNMFELNKCTV